MARVANFRAGQIGGSARTWAMGGVGLGREKEGIINVILVENSEEVRV